MPRITGRHGQILVFINVITSVLLIFSMAIVSLATSARQAEKIESLKIISKNIAEAAISKAIWCLNQSDGNNCGGSYGSSYSGENDMSFGGGVFDISITMIDMRTKEIQATAYYPSKIKILSKSIIKTRAATNIDTASFVYGAQVGEGGLEMGQSSTLNGSVYSLGDISGATGAQITGDAYVAGGTALAPDQQHTDYNLDFTFGKTSPVIDLAQSFIPQNNNVLNKISLYIKKVGSPADINIKIVSDNNNSPGSTVYAGAELDSSIVSTGYGWIDVSFGSPPLLSSGTKYWLILDAGVHSSKYWTIGTDAFDNYANGTMYNCSNWSSCGWSASGYDINFKIWLGGVETGIDDMSIGANAYAHNLEDSTVGGIAEAYNIKDSTIGGDARANSIELATIGGNASSTNITDSTVGGNLWCQSYANTTVGGTNYCPAAVVPPVDPGQIGMPISDALINEWKTDAESGGIINGDQTISVDTSLGPKKIVGNLSISTNKTLAVAGTIYVTGNITMGNGSHISLDSSYGSASGGIIADGQATINNGATFDGAGTGSYVMLITTFAHPTDEAALIGNADTIIVYAPHGIIRIDNNGAIKEAIGYKLKISNSASLTYEAGLSSISFSSGPAGDWSELKGTWRVIE